MRSKYPLIGQHLTSMEKMFHKYDADKNGILDLKELGTMLKDIDAKMTALPAVSSPSSLFNKTNFLIHIYYYRLLK